MRILLLAALLSVGCVTHQTHLVWAQQSQHACSYYSAEDDWMEECVDAGVRAAQRVYIAQWVGFVISLPVRIPLALVLCTRGEKACQDAGEWLF